MIGIQVSKKSGDSTRDKTGTNGILFQQTKIRIFHRFVFDARRCSNADLKADILGSGLFMFVVERMAIRREISFWLCILLLLDIHCIHAFLVHKGTTPVQGIHGRHLQRHLSMDPSLILAAVEVFDGSTIVDPVVVSDVFWTSLQGKFVAVIIGQALATMVFGLLSWFVTSQLSRLVQQTFTSIPFLDNDTQGGTTPSRFIKANELPNLNRSSPDFGKLLICLTIDVIGSSSEVLPLLGEITDVVYAPIAATVLRNLYGSNILFGLEFAEEILPFTDVLPLATIW